MTRADTGGTWEIAFNATDQVFDQITEMITTYEGLTDGKRMWFEVWSPYLEKAFFVVAQPPKNIPMPEVGQNELQTISLELSVEEYKGLDTAIKPEPSPVG